MRSIEGLAKMPSKQENRRHAKATDCRRSQRSFSNRDGGEIPLSGKLLRVAPDMVASVLQSPSYETQRCSR
jgi:hypothetical protein